MIRATFMCSFYIILEFYTPQVAVTVLNSGNNCSSLRFWLHTIPCVARRAAGFLHGQPYTCRSSEKFMLLFGKKSSAFF